jgi:hypothetical protein
VNTSSIFKKKLSLSFPTVNNIYIEPQKKRSINKSEILLILKSAHFNNTYRKVISSRFHSTSRLGEVRDKEVCFNARIPFPPSGIATYGEHVASFSVPSTTSKRVLWVYFKLYTEKILETNCFVCKIVLRYRGKKQGQFHETVVKQAFRFSLMVFFCIRIYIFLHFLWLSSYVSQWLTMSS